MGLGGVIWRRPFLGSIGTVFFVLALVESEARLRGLVREPAKVDGRIHNNAQLVHLFPPISRDERAPPTFFILRMRNSIQPKKTVCSSYK